MHVKLLRSKAKDKQELLGKVTLKDGVAVIEDSIAKYFEDERMYIDGDPSKGEVKAKDGEEFLKAIPFTFTGSYLRAELIK